MLTCHFLFVDTSSTKIYTNLKVYLHLIKLPISISVSLSALVGSYLTGSVFSLSFVLSMIGVFLLASAASAINQIQERTYDAQMPRTENRPLPKQQVPLSNAWTAVAFSVIIGTGALLYIGWLPAFLGILNIFFYNGVYTPLKRITSFAVIPGSLVGAMPPLIGYAAVGGNIFDTPIMFFAMLMFLWQVPHFWLLALKYSDEYIKAGFASITAVLSEDLLKHLILVWELAISILVVFFPLFGVVSNMYISYAIILLHGIYLIPAILLQYKNKPHKHRKLAFISINSLLLFLMILIIVDSNIA